MAAKEMNYITMYAFACLAIASAYSAAKGQAKTDSAIVKNKNEHKPISTPHGPQTITRNIIQDRKGNIWMAAFDGIFRYDGKAFTKLTSPVSAARFFALLEDRKGALWFGSVGAGVFRYDGKSFRQFTIQDGLLNNDVGSIYEDKSGAIWFGVFGGASRYDGKSFRNFIIQGDSMTEDRAGKTFSARPPFEVNSILEDKTGQLWLATRSHTFVYDGKTFRVFRKSDGQPFRNVRTLIEDRKGAVWLGGNDGLWRYDGRSFTNFIGAFTGYVYEDKKGAIWTSSESDKNGDFGLGLPNMRSRSSWQLCRFTENALSTNSREATIIRANEGMLFGILAATDGGVWFGSLHGVSRYDGKAIVDFTHQ